MKGWTLISTLDDFANLAVYERQGRIHKDYRITFLNYDEDLDKSTKFKIQAIFAAILFLPWIVMFFISRDIGVVMVLLLLPALFIFGKYFGGPQTRRRNIILDFNNDALKVFNENPFGKDEIPMGERKLSRLNDLSVGDHPETDLERANRARKNLNGPGRYERTHCLFGHFGVGGAEKLWIVQRVEWPKQNSLYEVGQAISWAMEKGRRAMEQQAEASPPLVDPLATPARQAAPQPQSDRAGSIKPPLD